MALIGLATLLMLTPVSRAQDSPWVFEVATQESPDGAEITITYNGGTGWFMGTHSAWLSYNGEPDAEGCTLPARTEGVALDQSQTDNTERYRFPGAALCNDTYEITIEAIARYHGSTNLQPSGPRSNQLTVAIPPDPPADVKAKANADRSVTVSWTSPYDDENPPPPDFVGFAVARVQDKKQPVFLGDPVTGSEVKDAEIPAEGGTFTYEVTGGRSDGADGFVLADTISSGKVTVAPVPSSTTDTTAPVGGPGGGDTGGGSGGTSGSSGGGISTGGTTRGSNPFLPKPRPTPTTLPDEGYESNLPYQQSEPGAEEAQAPVDILHDEGSGGSGLVRPIAVSLLLSAWALHILYITRAAQRANALVPALEVTPAVATPASPLPPPLPPEPAEHWLAADDQDPMEWWGSDRVFGED